MIVMVLGRCLEIQNIYIYNVCSLYQHTLLCIAVQI